MYLPSERQRRKSSARTERASERTVGAKNMHSSSGCAVIRSIRPVRSRSVEPAAAFTLSHARTTSTSRSRRTERTKSDMVASCSSDYGRRFVVRFFYARAKLVRAKENVVSASLNKTWLRKMTVRRDMAIESE